MSKNRRWMRITPCQNIPLREGRAVKIGHHNIAIFNLGDRFVAINNRCPHRGGPLSDGIVSGSTVVCPLHGWKIDLTSGAVRHPAAVTDCVETFPIRVEDGVIMLEIPVELVGFIQIAESDDEDSEPCGSGKSSCASLVGITG